ncbi:hypothetical protein TVAG_158240 [Trichomonas vaginalis G3]|uniref:Bap-like n=1 Tax=Trichomonas vaginalis (strain ATCC PRA-98 / G3) TaxID=412133 RepID=A2G3F4_TRIV3|nr:Bacterial Ig-like domain (group 3) family [Trichomonas vaginalis G3]EAX88311.1 hypothetical protein TVAG_158240 [Trichomonas vaginalis G3]KAI5530028.1 Bacterial Ig-like domain (group 3) family [Trichomonas vaginalis G3]|eukprot:XP_001301241.1 hypothetical protein [Trichomonas vaginalis G3]
MTKSSNYPFTVSIPSTLKSGSHTLNAKIIDINNHISNIVSVSFSFAIPLEFTLNNLQKNSYNKATDSSITISGSGMADLDYSISIKCQIDSTTLNANSNIQTSKPDSTFTFTGTVNFPSNFQEGSHTIYVWIYLSNGQSTTKQSKQFSFARNTPMISLSTTPKSKYTRNVDTSITISGTVSDKDADEIITVNSAFDGSSTISKSTQITVNDASNHAFSLVISFQNGFSLGSHTISIWAVDNNGKSTAKTNYPFTYVPSLSISVHNLAKDSYFKNIDTMMSITGLGDADFSSYDISIKFSIDNTEVQATPTISKSQYSYTFSASISIPSKLSESSHELRVWATSTTGSTTSKVIKTFYFYHNSPMLQISTPNGNTYIHNINKSMKIDGCVTDIDGDDVVKINAYFDGSSIVANSTTIKIQSSKSHCFSLYCPFPQTMKQGSHNIKLTAIDQLSKTTSETRTFSLKYNQPILEILEKPTDSLTIKQLKHFDIKLYIKDIDFNSKISIYFSYNKTQNVLLSNESLPNDSPLIKNYKFPIYQNSTAGTYKVYLLAYDQDGLASELRSFLITLINPSNNCCEEKVKKKNKSWINLFIFVIVDREIT